MGIQENYSEIPIPVETGRKVEIGETCHFSYSSFDLKEGL